MTQPNQPNWPTNQPPLYGPAHGVIPAQQPRRPRTGRILAGVLGGLVGLCLVGGIIGAIASGDEDRPASDTAAVTTTSPGARSDAPAKPAAPTTPAKAALTVSQEQALKQAQNYLEFSAFSRAGLIKQLKFEKFSTADATYAVDHVGADWTKQADRKAQEYLDSGMAFSRSGLIKQLEFEGFTAAQAKHGASAVGL